MMAASNPFSQHRVRKVALDFRAPDERTAFAVRTKLEGLVDNAIVPALNDAFDGYAASGHIHRIERLEVDLGRISLADLDVQRVRQAILAHLGQRLRQLPTSDVNVLAAEASCEPAFFKLVERGYWPWDSPFRQVEELERAMRAMPREACDPVIQRLRPLLRQRGIRRRVVYQFSNSFLAWLVQQLQPETAVGLLAAAASGLLRQGGVEAKQVLLAVAAETPMERTLTVAELQQLIRGYTEGGFSAGLDHFADDAGEVAFGPSPPVLSQADRPKSDQRDGAQPATELDLRDKLEQPATELDRQDNLEQPATELEPQDDLEPLAKEELYVVGAGIVMLHPFLMRFFAGLDLLDEERKHFVSAQARVVAIHLLHFLATGRQTPAEHETLLFKFLCGFPITAPLPKDVLLTSSMQDEAENLLSAVIRHWEKIGDTSPNGLRETFLQREGKLLREASACRLVVERRSLDVLLGFVPWSLSIVRSPWMPWPLWVDWG